MKKCICTLLLARIIHDGPRGLDVGSDRFRCGLLEADRFLIGNVKQALNYRAAMVWLATELAAVTAWSLNRPKDGGIR